ncbi:unnamed protein product [Ceratitis capitata]|uniref:(Mediterranean fruit fly) hypothetical protein n=1 Tax=Ceratitis capitata TaxID=7213 RepID=A0A811UE58_CERCA|nr:unnamed protein product [Ceratitis capitata]
MYAEVLPRLEQMLRDVGDETVLKACCLYATLSPRKVIVFEDIVPLGFEKHLKKVGFKDELPKIVRLREQLVEHKHRTPSVGCVNFAPIGYHRCKFNFFLLSSALPNMSVFVDPKLDMVKLLTSNDFRKGLYNKKVFMDEILQLLPKLKHLGYFEE